MTVKGYLQHTPLTKNASVVGLVKILIPEFGSLKLKASVHHPHGCGQEHIHCPCEDVKKKKHFSHYTSFLMLALWCYMHIEIICNIPFIITIIFKQCEPFVSM